MRPLKLERLPPHCAPKGVPVLVAGAAFRDRPDRVKRAIDMHPTPAELRSAIFDAIEDHNAKAEERNVDRFPVSAYRVIADAMSKCTTEHYRRIDNAG